MMRGPCEHCKNPMKEFWTTQCMYKGARDVKSRCKAPCALDADAEAKYELARRSFLAFWIIGGTLGVIAVIFYLMLRYAA